MLPEYIDYYDLAGGRQKAYQQEAEQMRQINAILQQNKVKHNYFWNTLNWFGIQIERWGQQLQNQFPTKRTVMIPFSSERGKI